ncbi:MAG: hypothetical protein R3D28_16790 [Geminicoccaceae bacterium]|nr:hypothetical protein [Geminicoccaceae bacterium]HRY26564.1 hypothetical protein [Geminicoccaceae bacterium]
MDRLARLLLNRLRPNELLSIVHEPGRVLIEFHPERGAAEVVELVEGRRLVLARDDDAGTFERVEVSAVKLETAAANDPGRPDLAAAG